VSLSTCRIDSEGVVEQREQIREDLAADIDGDPEDYNADTYHVDEPVADGGE